MDQQTKKKLLIVAGIAVIGIAGMFAKNKWDQLKFEPISRDLVINILKKAKKDNYMLLKKIASMAQNMAQQFKQISPEMIKTYLESPDSPVRIPNEFEVTFEKICKANNIKFDDFNRSVEYYIQEGDKLIAHYIQEADKDFNLALSGKLPQLKATVPEYMTKEKTLEIQMKLSMKKYLVQIEMYRKLKGIPKQRLAEDTQLMKSLPNPEEEEEKVLEEEGLGNQDEPPSVIFASAVMKYQADPAFVKRIGQIENNYKKIFNRYLPKMQNQTMTDEQINQLQDQIIYNEVGRF